MTVTLEDVAAVGQANFESALRQNVSMALSDAYDNAAINGPGGASPNINGLIAQLTNPTDPTAVATFDAFVAAYADSIDGLWASTMRDVAIVSNVDAYRLSAKTFRDRVIDTGQRGGVSLGDQSFADYAMEKTGGCICLPGDSARMRAENGSEPGMPGSRRGDLGWTVGFTRIVSMVTVRQ